MKPPIFIIGGPRSGTTLLRLMLTCHKNIVIPPECGFAVWLYDDYKRWNELDFDSLLEQFIVDLMKCRKIETWHLDMKGLLDFAGSRCPPSYSEAVSLVYEWYGLSQGRSFNRWGDKNNFHIGYIPTIKAIFPDVRFVHIVRDGRDVACSYKGLGQRQIDSAYAPRLPHRIEDIALEWTTNVSTAIQSFASIAWEHVTEIRFEDLVLDSEATLRNLCTRLGEEYDPRMLEYYAENRTRELEPKEFLPWKAKNLKPPIPTEVGRHRVELSEQEIASFQSIARQTLERYGYQLKGRHNPQDV